MAILIRRGFEVNRESVTPQVGELLYTIDTKKLWVGDGITPGGVEVTGDMGAPAPVQSVAGRIGEIVLAKTDVGLSNVDNTSDANKPISSAVQTALNAKASTTSLTSHTLNTSNPHGVTKSQVGLSAVDNVSAASLRDRSTHTGNQSIDTVAGLQTALNNKQETGDYATNSNLNSSLAGKADSVHTHTISNVTGLQTELDSKATTSSLAPVATSGSYNDLDDLPVGSAVWGGITGDITDQTDLNDSLASITDKLGGGSPSTPSLVNRIFGADGDGTTTWATPADFGLATTEQVGEKTDIGHTHVQADITDLTESAPTFKLPVIHIADIQIDLFGIPVDFTAPAGTRVLAIAQTDPTENGIYVVDAGTWTRAEDANSSEDFMDGHIVYNSETNKYFKFMMANFYDPFVLGTSQIYYTELFGNLDSHVNNYDNPHSVSAVQVGADTPLWNASKIQNIDVIDTSIANGYGLVYVPYGEQYAYVPQPLISSIQAGTNVTIDTTDALNPIINATGGGGGAVDSVNSQTGAVVLNQDDIADGTTYKQYSATEKTKLAGIATGATANDTDANLKDRANHTGTQAQSTVTNLTTDLAAKATDTAVVHKTGAESITGMKSFVNGSPSSRVAEIVASSIHQLYTGAWTPASPNATYHGIEALIDQPFGANFYPWAAAFSAYTAADRTTQTDNTTGPQAVGVFANAGGSGGTPLWGANFIVNDLIGAVTTFTAASQGTTGTSFTLANANALSWHGGAPYYPFYAMIWPNATTQTWANSETVKVTAGTGNTITVTRAQKSTTAINFTTGTYQIAAMQPANLVGIEINSQKNAKGNNGEASIGIDMVGRGAQGNDVGIRIRPDAGSNGQYYVGVSVEKSAIDFMSLGGTYSNLFRLVNGNNKWRFDVNTAVDGSFSTKSVPLELASNGAYTKNPHSFGAHRASAATIASGFNKVVYDTEGWDIGGNFDPSNGRFTATVAGVYHFDATVKVAAGIGRFFLALYKNGSDQFWGHDQGGTVNAAAISGDIMLAVSDYVEIYYYSVSAGTAMGTGTHTRFTGRIESTL